MRVRTEIRVRGRVQGVGFRPTVHRLACAAGLAGFVKNDGRGVLIAIEGDAKAVASFPSRLRSASPPLARIDALDIAFRQPHGDVGFSVETSTMTDEEVTSAAIPPDIATCDACLAELFDPNNRRHRYPFINCTNCGPRYSIVRDLPYDRAKTTMASFAMCADCRAEYEDPSDRRFHAEPIACRACGPEIALVVAARRIAYSEAALVAARTLLAEGRVLALKGLGGYQLVVDACNRDAVERLRERKRRPHKPFALMARDLASARRLVALDDVHCAALESPVRPIVLARARDHTGLAPSIAPGLRELGIMLPTTPLHHLLLRMDDEQDVLVMTSGNVAEEPLVKDDIDALASLGLIADAFLVHDRRIHTRVDDSVCRVVASAVQPVRYARGWAPEGIRLADRSASILAVGAEMKSAVCITRGDEAFLSQHIGEQSSVAVRAFFAEVIAKLQRLLGVTPEIVVHDLHPDYASTRWAESCGLPTIGVQHHHAHVAACLAEHGEAGPAIGVAFDGTGCGPDGDAWGGEILFFDLDGFERLGHLRSIALPGAEAAIREPWRVALAALLDARESVDTILEERRDAVRAMIERDISCTRSTGAGRWFDAVSAMLGVRSRVTYEAQAAIELESLASDEGERADLPYPLTLTASEPFEIDLRPAIRAIALDIRRRERTATVARRFHATMAAAVHQACRRARLLCGSNLVALSGGCFQNVLFTERTIALLEADGFRVLVHRRVPPNDGGIALGQAAIAARRIRRAWGEV